MATPGIIITDDDENSSKRKRLSPNISTPNSSSNTPFASPSGSQTDAYHPVVLKADSLIYYRTLRKVQKGILRADHHLNIFQQHVENGTAPRGLQANISTQIPEISTDFQLKWERAHLEFSSILTNILLEFWQTRKATLLTTKNELLNTLKQEAKEDQTEEIMDLLSKVTLNPTNTDKAVKKVAASRSRQNLRTPSTTVLSTSARRR